LKKSKLRRISNPKIQAQVQKNQVVTLVRQQKRQRPMLDLQMMSKT